MSRAIKVEDQVYTALDMIREKGETFSSVVERLLQARLKMFEAINMIEGILRYQEWKQRQLIKALGKGYEPESSSVSPR